MKTKKRILILGTGLMQGQAINAAKELGCTVVAVDGNPNAVCANMADEFFPVDLKDVSGLIELAKNLQADDGLDGVFTVATDFSASVAYVAEACGFAGHSLKAAICASNKIKMRECFKQAGVPSPNFTEIKKTDITHAEDILSVHNVNFPVAVKPCDNMGARGCKLVYSKDELLPALEDAVIYSRSEKIIVEEFITGEEFSLEALVIDGEIFVTAIADRHIFFPPYFVEMGHTIPSNYSQEETEELIRVFKLGIKALGLTNGAAKGDIFLHLAKDSCTDANRIEQNFSGRICDDNFMAKNDEHKNSTSQKRTACVGEIAARLSGGYMSGWTVPYSSGLNVTRAAIRIALGEECTELKKGSPFLIIPTKENISTIKDETDFETGFSAERAWISVSGKIKKIYGLEEAKKVQYVKDVFPRCFENDNVVFPKNNVEKCGNVLSAAPTYELAVKASMSAVQKIVLRLEPNNSATDEFLSSVHTNIKIQNEYPPNFFTLPDDFANKYKGDLNDCLHNSTLQEYRGVLLPSCFIPIANSCFDVHRLSLICAVQTAFKIEPRLRDFMLKKQTLNNLLNVSLIKIWLSFIRGSIQGLLYSFDCDQTML